MNWLNPINWFEATAMALVKSYALGKVKAAVNAKKDEIIYWCRRVGGWISKCEAVLAFLKSLNAKLEDGVLTDAEAKKAFDDAKKIAREVTKRLVLLAAFCLASLALGCMSDRTKDIELDGMFSQVESGTVAIGSIEFQAAPKDAESVSLKMWWDSPLLAPSEVRPCAKLMMSGTNTCSQAEKVVESITKAIGINFYAMTNAVHSVH